VGEKEAARSFGEEGSPKKAGHRSSAESEIALIRKGMTFHRKEGNTARKRELSRFSGGENQG